MYTPYGSTGPLEKEASVTSTKMKDDPRPILSVWDVTGQVGAMAGYDGVIEIQCYEENGQGAPVPWFAVWKKDGLAFRLNGAHIAIVRY